MTEEDELQQRVMRAIAASTPEEAVEILERRTPVAMITIRILGLINEEATPDDGRYVCEYDPTPRNGFVHLVTTENRLAARLFQSTQAAIDFYLQESKAGPRADGQPDRPLTAYTVEIS